MKKARTTQVKKNGILGTIVHDRLCADGPVDENGKPMIDPATGEVYPGPNDDIVSIMQYKYVPFMCQQAYIKKKDENGNTLNESVALPRFGVLSLLMESTPVIVYDHPRFKQIANTAFTDGIHIFVDADFARKLLEQEIQRNTESGIVFLLLHEAMHKLYLHVERLKGYSPRLANIAEDFVINGKLVKGFDLTPVPLLRETGVGMSMEEANKYSSMMEETVAEILLAKERQKEEEKQKQEEKKKKKEEKEKKDKQDSEDQENQPDQGDDPDQGQENGDEEGDENDGDQPGQKSGKKDKKDPNGSGEGDEDSDEENENGNSQSKPGKGKGSGSGSGSGDPTASEDDDGGSDENDQGNGPGGEDYSPIHHITPEELSQILEEEGLSDTVGKALNIPKPSDVEGLGKKKDDAKMKVTDAVQNALAGCRKEGGSYPGAHIAEEAAMLIDGLNEGKLSWIMALQEIILGSGMKETRSEEMPNDIYFLDDEALGPKELGLNQIYLPGNVPAQNNETVLCLVDSSGSTSMQGMRESFISEAVSMQDATVNNETAKEVVIWSADTELRGEPISITRQNMKQYMSEGVKMFGNGGTDFARCLHHAVNHPLMAEKKITNVVYFTDCCDNPPRREDYAEFLDGGGKITWITTPGMWQEAFNKGVEGWSTVYCIEENTVINLDRKTEEVNTRKNRV